MVVAEDSQNIPEDANSPSDNPSGFSYPTLEDAGMFCALICLAGLFLYSFIKYLKASPGPGPTDAAEVSQQDILMKDRRFRFSRLRSNSRNKAWLESLDPTDPPLEHQYLDDDITDNRHDADRLIQSDLSPETVMRELDPMGGLLSKPGSGVALNSLATNQTRRMMVIKCEMKEWLGIGLAAGTSIIFIIIFSNMEE